MVEVTSDLVYHQGDDRFNNAEGLVDVVAPTTRGPWPVVVAVHIHNMGRLSMLPMARDIADRGRVVFVPGWGLPDPRWLEENSLEAEFDLWVREVGCAVVFAKSHAAEYGGDPDHITLFGHFAGANAALMAGLAEPEPLEACVETGPSVVPQAVVSWDGPLLAMPPGDDGQLAEEPEAFYAITPWRHLDGSHDFPVYIATAENSERQYERRSFGSDPAASFIADRHTDIDLVAELDEMGLLDDGRLSLRDSNEWAYQTFLDAGYDTELVLLPDSTPGSVSAEGRGLVIDTVVHAERE
jgi:predicted esterase